MFVLIHTSFLSHLPPVLFVCAVRSRPKSVAKLNGALSVKGDGTISVVETTSVRRRQVLVSFAQPPRPFQGNTVTFAGHRSEAKDGNDCVLVYDSKSGVRVGLESRQTEDSAARL